MALRIEPSTAEFPEAGGQLQHTVVNASGARIAFKVKCSDNNLFTVRPVFALVDPGQAIGVDVTRKAGIAKQDKLVFQYIEVTAEEHDPQAPFRQPQQYHEVTLPLAVSVSNEP
uniref:MSP domain-containing protein n=1 Tax=Plectus sambesii TaxID=2011161 RepID=A0A914WPE0_9BILA